MEAVIFDLFETLITEWGKYKYSNRDVATDLGVDLHDFRNQRAILREKRYSGEVSDTIQFYKIILEQLGIERDEQLLQKIALKREECKRSCFSQIDTEILSLLRTLKKSGYKLGMISNCSTEEIAGLKDCALYNYFDAVVLSCDVGLIKPDVKIYEYCAELLQCTPSECFFVGDGGSDELNGAKKAGMTPLRALWFTKHFVKNLDIHNYPSFMNVGDLVELLMEERM